MNGNEPVNPAWKHEIREALRTVYWEERCQLAEKLLNNILTGKEIGRACHIHALEEKIEKLRTEITFQREAAEYRNRQLKAANLIVSCSGGCDTGVMGSKDAINEELVCDAERITKRLRSWWANYQHRHRDDDKE